MVSARGFGRAACLRIARPCRRLFVNVARRGIEPRVLPEDALNLLDHCRMIQANVVAMHKQFGRGAFQVRA